MNLLLITYLVNTFQNKQHGFFPGKSDTPYTPYSTMSNIETNTEGFVQLLNDIDPFKAVVA